VKSRTVVVAVVVAAGLAILWWISPAAFAVAAVIAGVVVAVIGLPMLNRPSPPDLVVEFRSHHPALIGRPALTRSSEADYLSVWVRNNGKGEAEAIEVTFGNDGAHLWNASGNYPDYVHLDPTENPPAWHGKERSIAPGDEIAIARLSWIGEGVGRPDRLTWRVRARGMKMKDGETKIDVYDSLDDVK
jgi:hypothetical protein